MTIIRVRHTNDTSSIHRVQQSAALDAQYRAKDKGVDVVKQWDSTLDNRTRPHHRMLDGQIRELDEDELNEWKERAAYFGLDKTKDFEEFKRKYIKVQAEFIAKTDDFGIIKAGTTKEVADVHTVGKIDREIYKCITDDIVTDEVIITDN